MIVSNTPAPAAPAAGGPLTERLRNLRDSLLTGLVERDVAIRLALVAALAGEHLLLLGPPGTAKSLVARRLRLAFADATYFERLLTRFTVPEELFGPLSIKGLEEDRYERLTTSYLPTAQVAFLDEIFKANSAILNALLTLLNEREFDNGTQRVRTPLIGVIGASNELPEGDELEALFDRFLLRLHVGPVSGAGFTSLLRLRGDSEPAVPPELQLTDADLQEVRAKATSVTVPADVEALLIALRDWCTASEIPVSDRRWRKVVKLLQVSALTNGRDTVSVWDCWLLQHCLGDTAEDREAVYAWYAERVGAKATIDPEHLTLLVTAWEGRLKKDGESQSQARSSDGSLEYWTSDGSTTNEPRGLAQKMRRKEPLFLAPDRASTNSHYDYTDYQISDRSNNGKGYTIAELDSLYINTTPGSYRTTQFQSWQHRETYLSNTNSWLKGEVNLVPKMEPTRFSAAHVAARLAAVQDLLRDVEAYQTALDAQLASLDLEIHKHLWVTEEFAAPAARNLSATSEAVALLATRLATISKGFSILPLEQEENETKEGHKHDIRI